MGLPPVVPFRLKRVADQEQLKHPKTFTVGSPPTLEVAIAPRPRLQRRLYHGLAYLVDDRHKAVERQRTSVTLRGHPYKTVVSRFVHRDVQSVSKRVLRDDRTINCALMSSDGPYVEQDRTSAPHEERRKGRQYRRRNIFLGQVDRTVHPGIGAARSQPERVTTRLGPTSRPWR